MGGRLHSYLSYANVMSTLAMFLVLAGGIAFALDRNSVKSKHIKNGQVRLADANEKAFGRGIVFGGIDNIPAGNVGAGYHPSGYSDITGGGSVVPTKFRMRDFRFELSQPLTSGSRVYKLGTYFPKSSDLRAGLSCEISAGEDSCTARGPSGVLRPGDEIQLTIFGNAAPGHRAFFSWRAATP